MSTIYIVDRTKPKSKNIGSSCFLAKNMPKSGRQKYTLKFVNPKNFKNWSTINQDKMKVRQVQGDQLQILQQHLGLNISTKTTAAIIRGDWEGGGEEKIIEKG